jgi:hypothetical protein
MKSTSFLVSEMFTEKGASVLSFGLHSILANLEPSGKVLPLPGMPAQAAAANWETAQQSHV